MSTNTHVIDNEMVNSFSEMLLGNDSDSINLAMEILDNRDRTDIESEKQYDRLMTMIINDNTLFPNKKSYILKIKGRLISVKDRAAFDNEIDAKKWLSLHLTKIIGTEKNTHNIECLKGSKSYAYLKSIKKIFKSGIKLRDFLIKNNLVQIEEIK
jgi:hypothetical protein